MCWILWIVSKTKIDNKDFENNLLKLNSRWPDSHWIFNDENLYLWHTRLSIIDIDSRANQPFIYKDYVLIFNWEIYNFREIKEILLKEWFIFSTSSDTEVLLYSYIFWWENCTKYLDWMWAFCIFDKWNNKLFLSRDRIWEKPLLYYRDDNKFIFWSEINALICFLDKREIRQNNLALSNFDLYNFRHIPSPFTAFENIFKLEPWYNLIFEMYSNKLNKYKYFKIDKLKLEKDKINQFNNLFKKSVENTCFADVPVWIFLSWWIDSSLIASIMKNRDITTYSLWYDENDPEVIRADKIAKYLWVKNKRLYFKEYLEKVDLVKVIEKVIEKYWEPINLMQIVYSDLILKEMKKDGIIVAVWWNWADEMFYWYDGMNLLYKISELKEKLDKVYIWKLIPNYLLKVFIYKYYLLKNIILLSKYKKFIYTWKLKEYSSEIVSKKLIDIFSWIWLRIENEHSITIVNDLVGSINGMELRTPFLNKDIINFSCNLEDSYKVKSFTDKKYNKYLLKKVLEKYLPNELIYNKKMWFWYWIDWIDKVLKNKKTEYYIKQISPKIGIYDNKKVLDLYNIYIEWKKVNKSYLMSVLINSIWFEKFIDNN